MIPRLARVAGHQLASEMLLLGRPVTAQEAATRFGLYVCRSHLSKITLTARSVNKVVPKTDVLKTAVEWAQEIVGNSPDSVQSTKRALMLSNQLGDVEDVVVAHTRSKEMLRVYGSDNIKVGTLPVRILLGHTDMHIRRDLELSQRYDSLSFGPQGAYSAVEKETSLEEPGQTLIAFDIMYSTIWITSFTGNLRDVADSTDDEA